MALFFKTPWRLAVFLTVLAAGLFATAHLVAGWFWPVADEARKMQEGLDEGGIQLKWNSARRDIWLRLVLDGVSLSGLPVERMTLGGDRIDLEGVRAGPTDFMLIAEVLRRSGRERLRVEGALGIGYDVELIGRWSGGMSDGGLRLTGEARLVRKGRELEVSTSFYLTGNAVYLQIESEKSLVIGRLEPEVFFFSPRLDATELTGLWGGDPLQAKGSLCAMGRPDENRWLVWSSGLEVRRRGAPDEFSTGPLFLDYGYDEWSAWLADLGAACGTDAGLSELTLSAGYDVGHLARSILPLGSTGKGWVEGEIHLNRRGGRDLSLIAESVSLALPDGMSVSVEGGLGFQDGSPWADCRFDTGGGWLEYRFEEGGKGVLSGEGIELGEAWMGALLLRDKIFPVGEHFAPLFDPPALGVRLDGCRWGDLPLGNISGELERGADGWAADLTLMSEGGRADCVWRFNDLGNQRISARFRGIPLQLIRILGADEAGIDPTAGRVSGEVELTLSDAGLDSLRLDLTATGIEAPLPPFLASLWRWADTGVEPPALSGAELQLTWNIRGREAGGMAIRLTSPDLRVTLGSGSRAAWPGPLELSGRLEVPPRLARRMSERGSLVFRTMTGWGAVPFYLGGTWTDPQPRLDLAQSRLLAAAEPPPGMVDW